MQILHVIPIARSLETEVLSYFSVKKVDKGTIVTVPLRKKKIQAIVINSLPVTDLKSQVKGAGYQLRNIAEVHPEQIFSSEFLTSVQTIKNFYASTTGKVLNNITPSFLLKDLASYHRKEIKKNTSSYSLKVMQKPLNERVDHYKTLFREKKFHDESLHIMCPTREHVEYLFEHLKKHNDSEIFIFHGGMTKKRFFESYTKLTSLEKSSLVISTPNFIDIPQYNLSTIVIEHESSDYYRHVAPPFIDMRLFIEVYAQNTSLECIFADGIIRPETWYKVEQGTAETIEPFHKKVFKHNEIQLIQQSIKITEKQSDLKRYQELTKQDTFSTISEEAREYIKNGILQQEKIFLYVHKTSLAPSIVCQDCGNIARSPSSGYPFSLYTKKNNETRKTERVFICHMTGESIPAFDTCQFCKSWKLVPLGIGIERVQEELDSLFPKTPILMLDGKHSPTKKKQKEVREAFTQATSAVILLGTSMTVDTIYEFDRSVVISLDSYFARMSYMTHHHVLELINTLNEKTRHPLLVQSRNILGDMLPILKSGMYLDYVDQELKERKDYLFPPFTTVCVVHKLVKKEQVKNTYRSLRSLFHDYDPQIMISPSPKKGIMQLITILHLGTNLWNMDHQDPKLQTILNGFDRSTTIHINPKNILS